VCVGSAAGQCDVLRVVYDAAGERVAEQAGATLRTFVGPEQVRTDRVGVDESRLEITAFGERIAYAILQSPRHGGRRRGVRRRSAAAGRSRCCPPPRCSSVSRSRCAVDSSKAWARGPRGAASRAC
jgi:hypothetical protein